MGDHLSFVQLRVFCFLFEFVFFHFKVVGAFLGLEQGVAGDAMLGVLEN